MKFEVKTPPRRFKVNGIEISDCGNVALAADEQVTFITLSGAEYDVARKSWGFYATPSLNSRLARMGLRGALVANSGNKLFVMLVEPAREAEFHDYLKQESARLVAWVDTDAAVQSLLDKLSAKG